MTRSDLLRRAPPGIRLIFLLLLALIACPRVAAAGGAAGPAEWPDVPLTALEGGTVKLAALAQGRPMVLNLWATWCPPCREEMPLLALSQQRESGVRFVFANQGESAATVQRYLFEEILALDHVLLDPASRLRPAVAARGLPTTLFYDAEGRLVARHVGVLSKAVLESKLALLRTAAPEGGAQRPAVPAQPLRD